ncbi:MULTISPECIES: PstS family phosphate ABC transporter substrate-binding protein [unclassified Nocardioides]|uniref:PstS family phosphate ABC transporter substrate-binding protein n=1 Tax=unclassified Nocardioides TaxID=2615069 RepID=UPI0000570EFB|nr:MULTISPECIES: PstS family phosphate ABC transporter substrate-binding protein [unclassified Nocardioides]ABL79737.1 phosphate ABC transporter substrate-binding protein, PhoT family [Nocardioides sp. JS614]
MRPRHSLLAAMAGVAITLAACGGSAEQDTDAASTGVVIVDGSSTVYPMSEAAYQLMSGEYPDIHVSVTASGTGGGFAKFCVGETHISNASRPIDPDETKLCEENGVAYTELQVGIDALTVVVHPRLGVDCLTTDQLVELWRPGADVARWNDLDPSFPDQKVVLFGPGTDSGTYDYLADVIGDPSEATRDDYESSEDDNVLVQGVAGTPGATGYFGYTYYEEYADALKAVAIDDGNGCVAPSARTAGTGKYTPLSRPLFIYVNDRSYAENTAVKRYTDFYIANLSTIAHAAQFIDLNEAQNAETREALEGMRG